MAMARRMLVLLTILTSTWLSGRAVSVFAHTARLEPANGARLQMRVLWRQKISPDADSAPAYLAHIGTRTISPILYVLAANNGSNCSTGNPVLKATLFALNASNGSIRWAQSTSGPSRCSTAGPVVDSTGQWVYAPGLDGKVHRYKSLSGDETSGSEWPVPVTLMPDVEKVSATPTISGTHLYVTTSGFIGDQGHYQGHVVTIDLPQGRAHVFNSLCSNIHTLLGSTAGARNYCRAERSGLFGRGQGVVDPVSRAVYFVTGNGAWNGKTNWGDSVLKLNATGTKLLDSYTPTNQAALDAADQDLGSTGSALLAPIRQGGHTWHLLAQGGKGPACASCNGAAIRLLNRDNLSGHSGKGHLGGDLFDAQAPGGCEILTAPAVWKPASGTPWVFYANDCGVAGYRVSGSSGHFRLNRVWNSKSGGTTPILSGDVLFLASAGHVTAFDPATGRQLAVVTGIGDVHWEYPRIAAHRLYISDGSGHVSCYSLAS
jgi:outer membrane protein assembly factor BamB